MLNAIISRQSLGFSAIAMLLLLGGCAASPHHAMAPEAAKKLDSVAVHVGIEQSEIDPTIEVSTAGGANFGLIGALVDAGVNNSRAESADAFIRPLRDALIDYDFDGRFMEEVDGDLEKLQWFGDEEPGLFKATLDERYKATLRTEDSDAVLFLTTNYETSPDFDEVKVTMQASMFPVADGFDKYRDSGRAPKSEDAAVRSHNAIYRNVITAVATFPSAGPEDAELQNVKMWSADKGRLARKALDAAIDRASMMLAMDLPQVEGEVVGTKGSADIKVGHRRARVAHEEGDVTVYRYTDGSLYSKILVTP